MLTVASKLYVSCTHTPTLSFLSSSLSDFFLYTSPTIGTGFLGILNTGDMVHIVFVVGLSGWSVLGYFNDSLSLQILAQ